MLRNCVNLWTFSNPENWLSGENLLFPCLWVGGKIIPRIRLTSANVLVEVEAELGNMRGNGIQLRIEYGENIILRIVYRIEYFTR